MTVVEVLERARERVARGWCQGDGWRKLPDGTEQFCLFGATGIGITAGAADLMIANLIGVNAYGGDDIADWNDQPRRTQADVLSVLDRVITLARSAP